MTTLAEALANPDSVILQGTLIKAALDTLDARVDGLEALITSTNTKIDTLNTAVASTAPALIAQADEYETVAASQTDQVLGATGATGDRIAGFLINPATTSPGTVSPERRLDRDLHLHWRGIVGFQSRHDPGSARHQERQRSLQDHDRGQCERHRGRRFHLDAKPAPQAARTLGERG
jgi:hypothetical protein